MHPFFMAAKYIIQRLENIRTSEQYMLGVVMIWAWRLAEPCKSLNPVNELINGMSLVHRKHRTCVCSDDAVTAKFWPCGMGAKVFHFTHWTSRYNCKIFQVFSQGKLWENFPNAENMQTWFKWSKFILSKISKHWFGESSVIWVSVETIF